MSENLLKELTTLIRVQLTDGGKLKCYAEADPREQPEQICRALFPRVAKAKHKLKINDEFEEDKVGVKYVVTP